MTPITRRRFLADLPAVAALSVQGSPAWARPDPPPETDRILVGNAPLLCFAPLYLVRGRDDQDESEEARCAG
jgi:hypothetical protein